MIDLIANIQPEVDENEENTDKEEDSFKEIENTSLDDIEEFNKWVKMQASKDLSKFKNLTNVCDVVQLRSNISSLNYMK